MKILRVLRRKFWELRLWIRCGCTRQIKPLRSKKTDGLRADIFIIDEMADYYSRGGGR